MGRGVKTLQLFFLGPPVVRGDGKELHLRSRKVLALLAYLAVSDQPHSRDVLAELLHPAVGRDRARAGLRQTLSLLRSTLGPGWIETDGDAVRLLPREGLWVDVSQVAKRAGAKALEEADALFRGDFLAGFSLAGSAAFDRWQQEWTDGLRQKRVVILAKLSALSLAGGDPERAVGCARRWVSLDPFDETGHRALMRAFAWAGNRAEALRQYEQCRRLLAAEIGAEPDEQTEALRAAILEGKPLPAEAFAGRAVGTAVPPHNLVSPHNAFFGRDEEVRAITQALRRPEVRLLTITGTAGTGKTRLAEEVGRRVLADFPDGVFFVDLAPMRDPDQVVPGIAATLGVEDPQGSRTPLFELVCAWLAPRRMLLILDNFEHLVDAARSVAALVDHCPRVSILATSREPLKLRSESEYLLMPLQVPSEEDALEDLAVNEAVSLFVDRAVASSRGFALTQANARDVARICGRLDGLPLAIELAAGRSRFLQPATLMSLLETHGLALLTGSPKDVPERHRTLGQAIDWSYALLTPRERALLTRLAVFHGGFTLGGAASVCAAGSDHAMMDDLGSLVEKNLVRQVLRDDEPWYSLFVTVREMAEKRLAESGEWETLHLQHARYYTRLAEEAVPFHDRSEGVSWARLLEREYTNIGAAAEWSLKNALELALRIASALERFLGRQGHWRDGRQWLRRAIEHAEGRPDLDRWRAAALAALCNMTTAPSMAKECVGAARRSVALWRAVGDSQGLGHALLALGLALSVDAAPPADILPVIGEAERLRKEAGDRMGHSASMFFRAFFTWMSGDAQAARRIVADNLALAREIGDLVRCAALPGLLGVMAAEEGDYARAQSLVEEGLASFGECTDCVYSYHLGASLAGITLLRGDLSRARKVMVQTVRATSVPEEYTKPVEKLTLGLISLREHHLQKALSHLREGIAFVRSITTLHARQFQGACLAGIAGVAVEQDRPECAGRILGSVGPVLGLFRQRLGQACELTVSPTLARVEFDRQMASVRAALGAEADTVLAEGRALSPSQAADLAFAELA